MGLRHFYSEVNGMQVKGQNHATPTTQTVQQAITLGRVAVGNCDVIHNKGYIVVVAQVQNGLGGNRYRDMYEIINK